MEQNSPVTAFPVKLTINSRHILPQMGSNAYSMFSGGQEKNPQPEVNTAAQLQDLMESLDEELDEDAEIEQDMVEQIEDMFRALFESAEPDEENSNRYILTTEGTMESDENEYRLKYIENPDNGFGDALTVLHISKSSPTIVIERSGTLMSTLCCEKGKRHISDYSSPMMPMPFSVCIYTRKFDSTLTESGGVILLDYLVELRGADIQRTTMRINVVRM
ncbi:MAG: DUF1934 domain-containing protein [Clostridia bacterium]|nr:DUF1934 domain-containing protein [Clostridia bacterium]